mgnify:CR=1 FL=1
MKKKFTLLLFAILSLTMSLNAQSPLAAAVARLCFTFHHMDVADLAANALFTGPDLFIQNNTAADAGSECHHNEVFIAFSAALPHLAESRDIRVISAFDRHSIQQSA